MPGALVSIWKSEDRPCLVASNAHEYVALQNKWTIVCIYLSGSADHCSWKATFCVYGRHSLPSTSTVLLFIENAFHSDVKGYTLHECWLFLLQVGVVRKALLFQEGFSIRVFFDLQVESVLLFPACNLEQNRILDYFSIPSLVSFALWVWI